ncbi:protein wntless homolog [Gigantopelta aegis]|uniref:protein wntless homolog n=1 Tax=Gigantopelta aegis TaxID=1735272 RepID=UPI001B88DC32|nr:protein wntless homolog [Gigantopelta aegis]
MAGVVLENLSNRKLSILSSVLLLIIVAFFLIGGLIAPAPANVQSTLAVICIDNTAKENPPKIDDRAFFIPRGDKSCKQVDSLSAPEIDEQKTEADQVVFSQWIPLPRGGEQLKMSRWFQHVISVIQLDIKHSSKQPMGKNPVLTMDVRLGYSNKNDSDWYELARAKEERPLDCYNNEDDQQEGDYYHCEPIPFFELGSCHHHYYVINIRIPVRRGANSDIGQIEDVHIIAIHQNGGFTKVWFSIKTVLFPSLLAVIVWFWRRIQMLSRLPNLLERTLFALGIVLSILNCPIEWLTLWFDMPFMMLIGDVRQGAFYAMLLSFWIIFAGEHMMDQLERNRLVIYWKHLGAVVFGCLALFVFEICERGVQLSNPFYSIWVTETGRHLALAFIILAGFAACTYFIFLCYMVYKVFRNISSKSTALPQMSSVRRKYYKGLIFRFKFLMLTTLLCAALTVIFFIISQVSEGRWKWGDEGISLEYSSAFLTGVYGIWNVYVIALLSLYAPSHKNVTDIDSPNTSQEEEVQLTQIPSEVSAMTAFTSKAAAD